MSNFVVIEVGADPDGAIPIDLVSLAYRTSRWDRIALIVGDSDIPKIDRALDGLVDTMPLDIPGVRYIRASSDAEIRQAVREADLIFVATERLLGHIKATHCSKARVRPIDQASKLLPNRAAETL